MQDIPCRYALSNYAGDSDRLPTAVQSMPFSDASLHLYKRPCPSVRPSVGPSVGRSVTLSSKSIKNGLLRILSDLDSARRKERRGGRSDEASEKMKKL